MTWDEGTVRQVARRAYERGRWRSAMRVLWLVAPLIALGLLLSEQPGWSLAFGAALFVLTGLARWRGGLAGSAATTGLLAGLPAYFVPAVGMWGTGSCDGDCCSDWCLSLCVAGGLLTGACVGVYAATRPRDRLVHAGIGVAVSALTAAVACTAWGWAATGAMAGAALVLAGGVTLVLPMARASAT
jgi:hypothetical protein